MSFISVPTKCVCWKDNRAFGIQGTNQKRETKGIPFMKMKGHPGP